MQDAIQDATQGRPPQEAQPGPQAPAQASTRSLTRSHDRMLGGVAGGLGDYFDIDPTIVRLGLVLAALISGGFVIVAYLALWMIMPEAPSSTVPGLTRSTETGTNERRGANGALILGVILVAIGGIALLEQFPMFHFWGVAGWGIARFWWPSLLIAVGVALVLARARD